MDLTDRNGGGLLVKARDVEVNWTLAVIVAVAAVLRFYRLDHWSLYLDECIQYYEAAEPLAKLYATLFPQEMPAFFIIGHAFIRLGLDSPWWLRALPAALGTATVPIVYLLGRELFGRSTGLWTAMLAALSPLLIIYSQDYRFYALLVLLTCTTGLCLVKALRTDLPVWWGLFAASAIFALYTHHTALVLLGGFGVFAAISIAAMAWQDQLAALRRLFSASIAGGIVGIAYLPGFPMLLRNLAEVAQNAGFIYISPTLLLRTMFGDFTRLGGPEAAGLGGLVALGLIASLWLAPRAFLFLITTWLLPLAVLLVASTGRTTMSPRYTVALMPAYCMVAAFGIAMLFSWLQRAGMRRPSVVLAAGAIALCAPGLYRIYTENPKEVPVDTRSAYDFLTQRTGKDDVVLEAVARGSDSPYWFRYWSYYRDRFYRDARRVMPTFGLVDDINFPKDVTRLAQASGKLWVVLVGKDETAIAQIQSTTFASTCFQEICVLESLRPAEAMAHQIDELFADYARVLSRP